MENVIVVSVSELVQQTATRARGKEAYENLKPRMGAVLARPLTVIVDFTGTQSVTASFIDELVLRFAELPADVETVFRLSSERDLEKLQRVCAIRAVHCRYQIGESGVMRRTRRMSVPRVEAQEYPGTLFAV